MRWLRRLGSSAIVCGGLLAASIPAMARKEIPFKITTEDEVADLVADVVGRSPMGVNHMHPGDAFFLVQVLYEDHDGTAGWYMVNPWTGDVWDVGFCKQGIPKHSKALSKAQAEIKKRFSKDELKHYGHLRRIRPGCLFDD